MERNTVAFALTEQNIVPQRYAQNPGLHKYYEEKVLKDVPHHIQQCTTQAAHHVENAPHGRAKGGMRGAYDASRVVIWYSFRWQHINKINRRYNAVRFYQLSTNISLKPKRTDRFLHTNNKA